MKIRSITYLCNPGWPLDESKLASASIFLAEAKSAFESAGYEVQTTRMATVPFPTLLSSNDFSRHGQKATEVAITSQILKQTPQLAQALEAAIRQAGISYASLGPALPEFPESYAIIPEALAATQNIFFGGVMAAKGQISLPAVRACAEVICRCAPITPDGFANLRFAALANVPPGAPFFPAAYADGGEPAFAIATEAADLAVQAFSNAQTIEDGRRVMVADMQRHSRKIVAVADSLTRRFNLEFGGLDFSLGEH